MTKVPNRNVASEFHSGGLKCFLAKFHVACLDETYAMTKPIEESVVILISIIVFARFETSYTFYL